MENTHLFIYYNNWVLSTVIIDFHMNITSATVKWLPIVRFGHIGNEKVGGRLVNTADNESVHWNWPLEPRMEMQKRNISFTQDVTSNFATLNCK